MAFEYRFGDRQIRELPLDADAGTVAVGTAMTTSGATAGYLLPVDASGEAVIGIAVETTTAGAADGDVTIRVDTSKMSVYEVGPDTGSITQAIAQKTCDVGADGLTLNIDASATDDIEIIDVDTDNNTAHVRLLRTAIGGVA